MEKELNQISFTAASAPFPAWVSARTSDVIRHSAANRRRRVLIWDGIIVALGMLLPASAFALARHFHAWAHGACSCLPGLILEYGPAGLLASLGLAGVLWVLTRRNRARLFVEEQLRLANERMETELEAAAQVQRALLPTSLPGVSTISFGSRFRPSKKLAGDIFDVFSLNESWIGLYALDVSGHGTAAALLSVAVHRALSPLHGQSSLVRERVGADYVAVPPSGVLKQLNERFQMNPSTRQYFTILYGVVNTETMEFRYACGGHPAPVHVPGNRPGGLLKGSGFPVGLFTEAEYEEYVVHLSPGDRFYLYSDGVTDATDAGGRDFGVERLFQILSRWREASLEDSLSCLFQEIQKWTLDDDATVIGFEVGNPAE